MDELREEIAKLLQDQLEAGPHGARATADMILTLEPLASALRSYQKNNATYLAAKGHRIDTSLRKPTSPASKTNP